MRSRQRRRCAARALLLVVMLVGVALVASADPLWSHPLHTTLTEVALDPSDGTMRMTIRAFADDFTAAVAKHAGKPRPTDQRVSDADVASYVAATVLVEDPVGHRVPVAWGGLRRTGDLMWVTIRVPSVRSVRGIKLATSILFESFGDQVNIVQFAYGGRRHSMLFTGSDRKLKAIP